MSPPWQAAKLSAFDNLLFFLQKAPLSFTDCEVCGYFVRRVVTQIILSNLPTGLDDPGVFRRLLKVITALWSRYRRHLKTEIGVLFEHLMLRVLRLGPQVKEHTATSGTLLTQQMDVLDEAVRWFDMPHNLCELFLNYDMDSRAGVKVWRVCEQLCEALCTVAEQCAEVIKGQASVRVAAERYGAVGGGGRGDIIEGKARQLQEKAMGAVCHVVRSLMDVSGHVYMMRSDEQLRSKSVSAQGGWETRETRETESAKRGEKVEVNLKGAVDVVEVKGGRRRSMSKSRSSVIFKQEEHERTKETLKIAFDINKNKGLKKCLNYLMACNFLTDSPRDVSNFLRMYQTSLDDVLLGDYLGEGGVGSKEEEYWNLVRYHYVRAVSFESLNVEQGLRHYLTSCGFRLPGESQKIDRLMSTFAHCFWEDNSGDSECCPFHHQDTIYLLAFAIIMLNTDLHKMSVDNKRSSRRKMNKAEFMKNLRGVDTSISTQYLSDIFDKIEGQPIEMNFEIQRQQAPEEGTKGVR